MRILLTHSYFVHFDPKQEKHGMPYPPLGTLYAASVMREEGYEVKLFDTMFASTPEEIIPVLDAYRPDVLVIYDDGFNYLTKMCLTNMREAACKMQTYAAKRGCRVITAGSDATDHYEQYLQANADYVLIGEAEYTLLELLNTFRDNTPSDNVNGVAYYNNGTLVKSSKRAVKKDLDTFPLPAWDLVDVTPYRDRWLQQQGYFSLNVATTRGCPYKCNWCAKPIYGNIYNMRSPANVVKELVMMKEMFGYDHIWFCDDIFGLKYQWVIEFAELVKSAGLTFKYKIQSRADLLVQEKYVESLAASGCDDVWMGAESGSQKILDAMDKGTTVEQIIAARQLLKQHHIKASFFLQFGYPGEEMQDIDKTIALVKKSLPDDIGISVSYPLPGTVFYERVKSELTQKANWTDSDDLALMFHNTYPPAFYKILHRLVHSIFRKRKALAAFAGLQFPLAFYRFCKYAVMEFFLTSRLKRAMSQK